MATLRRQRIGIWVIAIVLTIGTIGSFLVMILASKNSNVDKARINQLTSEYQKKMNEYQAKVDAQATELSSKYFAEFSQYADRFGTFDRDGVKSLKTEELKQGDGETLGKDTSFTAYYIGWTPDGKVFDSSIDGSKLKAPFNATPGGVIKGWTQGVEGMKIGGIRELTIPSEDAYGEQGSGNSIPPNTPLKFVIMIIPPVESLSQPAIPQELLNYYNRGVY